MKCLDDYFSELGRRGLSDSTRTAYLAAMRTFAEWLSKEYSDPFSPGTIVEHDVRMYRAHLIKLDRSPSTINQHLAALAAFTQWAVGAGLLSDDPCAGIAGVKSQIQPPRALDDADLKKLRRAVHHRKNAMHVAVIELMVNAGLRVSEVVDLVLADVELGPKSGKAIVRHGKGNKRRIVPLNVDARRALVAWLEVRPAVSSQMVFIGERGSLTAGGVWWIVNQYAKRAGIECSPHVLRHTFATRLVREFGVDLVTVADMLGHDNVNTTARYARSNETDRQAAVDRL
jgi:site-specific recombinase XerD